MPKKKKRKLPNSDKKAAISLSPEEGVAAIGFIALVADGEVGDEEAEALAELVEEVDLFDEYSDEDLQDMFTKFGEIAENQGGDVLFNAAVEALPDDDYREAAFIAALLVIAIDGDVPDEELEYIDGIRQILGISEERASEIADEMFGDEEDYDEEDEDEE